MHACALTNTHICVQKREERAAAMIKILDGSWTPPAPEVPLFNISEAAFESITPSTRKKSRFSSARAGIRVKTTVETVREEFAASGIAAKPKGKSRIMQPSNTFQF